LNNRRETGGKKNPRTVTFKAPDTMFKDEKVWQKTRKREGVREKTGERVNRDKTGCKR